MHSKIQKRTRILTKDNHKVLSTYHFGSSLPSPPVLSLFPGANLLSTKVLELDALDREEAELETQLRREWKEERRLPVHRTKGCV